MSGELTDVEDVDTIAVLGAGTMGHGIAEVAALAGYDVTLRDIEEALVQEGYEQIEWSLEKLVENETIEADVADATLDRITTLVDLQEAVGNADVVIEAVPERMDVKRDVYDDVEAAAPDRTIFTTNTSSLSISDLAETTDRPERFCGMHFFNPPVRMELVEVITGEHTTAATLELVEALAESMDKTPVRVRKDTPGFIVNRVLLPMLNEAAWIVHDEAATMEAVEVTTREDLELPMGAFELADQVGIDVVSDILAYMHDQLGPAYDPCPLFASKVEAGELGRKSGVGFYDYEQGGPDVPEEGGEEEIRDRLAAVLANEVAKLVAGDVADPSAIDRAMRLGAGFPEGPARLADELGADRLVGTLEYLQEKTDAPRYEVAGRLRNLAEEGETFHED